MTTMTTMTTMMTTTTTTVRTPAYKVRIRRRLPPPLRVARSVSRGASPGQCVRAWVGGWVIRASSVDKKRTSSRRATRVVCLLSVVRRRTLTSAPGVGGNGVSRRYRSIESSRVESSRRAFRTRRRNA
jgi:hypothetical protein